MKKIPSIWRAEINSSSSSQIVCDNSRAWATGARLSFSFPVSRWVPCSPGPIFCAAVYFASQRACTRSAMVKEDEQKKKPYRHDDNIATEKAGGQAAGAPLHMRAMSLSIHITAVWSIILHNSQRAERSRSLLVISLFFFPKDSLSVSSALKHTHKHARTHADDVKRKSKTLTGALIRFFSKSGRKIRPSKVQSCNWCIAFLHLGMHASRRLSKASLGETSERDKFYKGTRACSDPR